MAETQKVTREEATVALQQLVAEAEEGKPDIGDPEEAEPSTPEPEPEPKEEPAPEPEPEAEPTTATPAAESDDVESLKKRLAERDAKEAEDKKLAEARWTAMQARAAENERILHGRLLRKSAVVDRARQLLEKSKTQDVSLDEVDRVIQDIQGTLNPESTNYAPVPARTEGTEDQAITLNRFLNEKGMTAEESEAFGRWIQTDGTKILTPSEQALAQESLGGFLRIAHRAWQDGIREKQQEAKRAETVNAVKTIQRTQKQAAQAASASTTAPIKQPAGQKATVDTKKLTKRDVAELMQLSVKQYE